MLAVVNTADRQCDCVSSSSPGASLGSELQHHAAVHCRDCCAAVWAATQHRRSCSHGRHWVSLLQGIVAGKGMACSVAHPASHCAGRCGRGTMQSRSSTARTFEGDSERKTDIVEHQEGAKEALRQYVPLCGPQQSRQLSCVHSPRLCREQASYATLRGSAALDNCDTTTACGTATRFCPCNTTGDPRPRAPSSKHWCAR